MSFDRDRDIEAEGQRAVIYAGTVCRGSYALGTACHQCERCRLEWQRLLYEGTPPSRAEKPLGLAPGRTGYELETIKALEVVLERCDLSHIGRAELAYVLELERRGKGGR